MEFISPEGLRQDGRRAQELRQLKCEIGVLAKADGSASFEMGNTKVLAAVYGPKLEGSRPSGFQAKRGQVRCEVAISSFCSGERKRRARGDRRIQDYTAAVQASLEQVILLELLHRSEIEVFVQVLQADGGERAACINAAMLAVTNAGIAVHGLVAACEVGYIASTPLIDLNATEISAQSPKVTLASCPSQDTIALLEASGGSISTDVFEEICLLALEGTKAVAEFMRGCLLRHIEQLVRCQGVAMI